MKSDPYRPPGSQVATATAEPNPGRQRLITIVATISVIGWMAVLVLLAMVMIYQASSLASGPAPPPGRPNPAPSLAYGSWVVGLTAAGGAMANLLGLLFIRKRMVGLAIAICVGTILGMACLAILFKP